VSKLRALAGEAFDSFSKTESGITRHLPGFDREAFTDFYEFCREKTLEFSLAWFSEFLQIAKANRNLVPEDPTWWAHAQAHALLCQELGVPQRSTGFPFWRVRGWIQYFCDGKIPVDVIDAADLETTEGFMRIATRSDWRAPKWLWAWARKYYGQHSAEWDSLKTEAAAMEQLDQQKTEKLLDTITEHFWLHIDCRFSEHVALVSIEDARTDLTASKSAPAAQTPAIVPSPTTYKRADKVCFRQGVIFRAIEAGLKGLEYCNFLRDNGLTTPWTAEGCPESYPLAYERPFPRGRRWQQLIRSEKSRHNTLRSKLERAAPSELRRILEISRRPKP
jgi:hypothetical protein